MPLTLKPPKPPGIVRDPGGYYDPSRSTYVSTPSGLGGGIQSGGPGSSVYDPSGGYYDPSRGVYVPSSRGGVTSAIPTRPTVPGVSTVGTVMPPPPAGGAGGGLPPDYLAKLTQDPMYIAATTARDNAFQSSFNALRDQVRRGVISSGYVPDLGSINKVLQAADPTQASGNYASFLDDATLAAAKANPMSQAAQLNKAYTQNLSNLGWQLSGLGSGAAARSGQNVNDTNQYTNQYDVTGYGQMQDLLNALGGNVNNYLGNRMNAQSQWQSAVEGVAQRLAMLAAYGYGSPGSPGSPSSPGGDNPAPPPVGGGVQQGGPGGIVVTPANPLGTAGSGYYNPYTSQYTNAPPPPQAIVPWQTAAAQIRPARKPVYGGPH